MICAEAASWRNTGDSMAHAVVEEPQSHMGLPLPNGKLAMWLFLVTEIMFFTALIGVYIILRNGRRPGWSTAR